MLSGKWLPFFLGPTVLKGEINVRWFKQSIVWNGVYDCACCQAMELVGHKSFDLWWPQHWLSPTWKKIHVVFYYSDVMWASWHPRSLENWLSIQHIVQANKKESPNVHIIALLWGEPVESGEFPTNDQWYIDSVKLADPGQWLIKKSRKISEKYDRTKIM